MQCRTNRDIPSFIMLSKAAPRAWPPPFRARRLHACTAACSCVSPTCVTVRLARVRPRCPATPTIFAPCANTDAHRQWSKDSRGCAAQILCYGGARTARGRASRRGPTWGHERAEIAARVCSERLNRREQVYLAHQKNSCARDAGPATLPCAKPAHVAASAWLQAASVRWLRRARGPIKTIFFVRYDGGDP